MVTLGWEFSRRIGLSHAHIELATVVQRSEAMLFNNIGDEVVMMDIEQGAYYGLEKVAARIWALTEQPASVAALCSRLTDEYEVAPETCRQEVTTFLGDLINHGILQVIRN